MRGKPVEGPKDGHGFVRIQGKPVGKSHPAPVAPALDVKPTSAGEKAGAPEVEPPAPVAEETPAAPKVEAAPAEPAKPDPMADLKKGFDAKARELADIKKRLETFENLGKTDFKKLVAELAKYYKADPEAIAEQLLLEKATRWEEDQRLAQLSPEEREYHDLKKADEKRKADEKLAGEQKASEEQQAAVKHTYDVTTAKLIEAHKLLPEAIRNSQFNGRAALRISERLMAAASAVDPEMPIDQFLATVDPAKLAADAWADHRAELKEALLAMDDGALDEFVDPKLAERWTRKLQAQAVKKAHPALSAQPRTGSGQFAPGKKAEEPRPLSAMKPTWSSFLPKKK
jgi:hypothetical protein